MNVVKIKATGEIITGFAQSHTMNGVGIKNVVACPELNYTAEELEEIEIPDSELYAIIENKRILSMSYSEKRKVEYDKLNQFEMQFDDQRDGTTTWVDAINGIKEKHPKE